MRGLILAIIEATFQPPCFSFRQSNHEEGQSKLIKTLIAIILFSSSEVATDLIMLCRAE